MDLTFARTLAGKDALTLHTKTSRADVIDKCKKALMLYRADDYKKDFAFIDFVTPVQQRELLETLDALAFADLTRLVNGGISDLHIALPDILDPEEGIDIGYYGLGLRSGVKPAHTQLAIEDYIAELKAGDFSQVPDMAALRASHEVRVIADGEGDKKRKRKIYDCFVFEVTHRGNIYVLFGGEWFAVDKVFHASVESGFNKLVSANPFVSSTKKANERDFIKELNNHKDLLNLDQVKLNPEGMPGANLEPCDFLSTAKQFIHLKDATVPRQLAISGIKVWYLRRHSCATQNSARIFAPLRNVGKKNSINQASTNFCLTVAPNRFRRTSRLCSGSCVAVTRNPQRWGFPFLAKSASGPSRIEFN
jgi:uncharacterized protein (TIGR04141 family)